MKRIGARNGTRNKYLKVCYDIKNKCDNKIEFNNKSISEENNTSNTLMTFLKKQNVVSKNYYGLYEWNEKIPVTNKLITSFLNYVHEANKQSKIKREIKQNPTLFNAPSYIKDAKQMTVTVIPEGQEKEYIMDGRKNNGNKGHSTKAKGDDKRKNEYRNSLITTVEQPKQRRELKLGWGLLTIKF
jgi:hypothetical protein